MAYFHRMTSHLLRVAYVLLEAVLFLLFFISPAHAAFPATVLSPGTQCNVNTCRQYSAVVTPRVWRSSLQEACVDQAARNTSIDTTYSYTCAGVDVASATVNFSRVRKDDGSAGPFVSDVNMSWQDVANNPEYSCPSGATLSGGQCTCTAPSVQNSANDGCDAPASAEQQSCESFAAEWNSTLNPSSAVSVPGIVSSGPSCIHVPGFAEGRGCSGKIAVDLSYRPDGKNFYTFGSFRAGTGPDLPCNIGTLVPGTSTATVTPTLVEPTPTDCKGYKGTVNGLETCVPLSAVPEIQTSKTKTNVTTPADGTPTTTVTAESTTCADKQCTTTTAITRDGATIVSVTAGSRGDHCKANPNNTECGGSDSGTGWGGTCDSGFSCDGDAVQCALTKEVHLQNCKLNRDTEESALYHASRVKAGDQTTDLPGNDTVNMGSQNFNSSSVLPGGSCIGDLSVVVASKSISLPLSRVCPYLEYLGMILMGISALLSARIFMRG